MKTLLLYDSNFGNTKLVANEIAKTLGGDTRIVSVKNFAISDLDGVNLLILGSPIIGWKPTEPTMAVLDKLETGSLKDIWFTTFDTRVKLFFHGDAKEKMANILHQAGAKQIATPMAFYVTGREGPLLQGELTKAVDWARQITINQN